MSFQQKKSRTEANEALDYAKKDVPQREKGRGDYTALKGTAARWYESHGLGEEGHGLLTLPAPYCEPFRKMLVHPQVVTCLNESRGDNGTFCASFMWGVLRGGSYR